MKRFIIVALALLLACAGGAYYVHFSKVQEVQRVIEDIPGDLKADRISVSLFDNKVDIQGLKGVFLPFANSPYEVDIASVTLEGLNKEALKSPGAVKIVDRLLVSGAKWSAKGDPIVLLYDEVEYDSLDIQGLWADLGILKKIKSTDSQEFIELLKSLRYGPSTSGAIKMMWTEPGILLLGQSESVQNSLSFTSYVADAGSLLEYGMTEFYGMEYSNGVATAHMGKLRIASGKNPSVLFTEQAYNPNQAMLVLPKIMQEQYSMRGAEITDFSLKLDGMAGEITAPRIDLDVSLGVKELIYRVKSDSLSVPATTFSKLDPMFAFLPQSMDTLNLRLLVDLSTDIPEKSGWGNLGIRLELSEPELGDTVLDMTLRGETMTKLEAFMPFKSHTMEFIKAELKWTDRTFLDRMFADAPGSEKGSGALRRAELIAEQRAIQRRNNFLPSEIFEKAADFIEQSGTYQLDISVAEATPLTEFFLFPERIVHMLRVTATHQPPQ